ncbi:Putative peptidoglycan binding domain protein [Nocardioides dokdonensis FR1436]|uniref:Putative peptidoglycan binding domain protein n=1 Tax=Nocardioides dokdonensis FR1436 TaxID=1300347 RepID=A0A1A9GI34_9ACTN|nr:glycoside hydrolase domain-containing protein [Nocardioides dokdonensis]ANH37340.1 Putative peptidoglycan binding domain protein [Nocardioides dokdonensis FR1436]
MPRPTSPRVRLALAGALSGVLAATGVAAQSATVAATAAEGPSSSERRAPTVEEGQVVTPGDFTGYGFDQCLAPTQKSMNTWWRTSPFSAVGIYISGDSRACRNQPNLTPGWVVKQATKGWRLLPITLGPQASCQPRFPRYDDDRTIDPRPGKNGKYVKALKMGRREAVSAVAAAQALKIGEGSTLWYDLEGFDHTNTDCRESALSFLSGWTQKLHTLEYVSGVYSSVSSGIKALDDARVTRPARFALPDAIWLARWDGVANTSSSYIREDGWRPGGRVKQYRGGHDETWGGVRINIDSNYLDLGQGTTARPQGEACNGTRVNWQSYELLRPPRQTKKGTKRADPAKVAALQCLLKQKGYFEGDISGAYGPRVVKATQRWQREHGFAEQDLWSRTHWMSLLSAGSKTTTKFGSSGDAVRRLQRSLNAASPKAKVAVTGVYGSALEKGVKDWQRRVGIDASGVVNARTWKRLQRGIRS